MVERLRRFGGDLLAGIGRSLCYNQKQPNKSNLSKIMVTIPFEYRQLPTAEDLPCSDDTPVDNELQNDIPNMLR